MVGFEDRRDWVHGVSFAAADAAGVRCGVGLRWVCVVVVSFARWEGMLRGVGRGGGVSECSVAVFVGAVVVVVIAFELALCWWGSVLDRLEVSRFVSCWYLMCSS